MFMLIIGVVAIVLSVCLYSCYAGIIAARNQLDEALSGIDVQLTRRADLVPNVLKIAQKFMTHEEKIFTQITKLRTEALAQPVGTAKRFDAEEKLQKAMTQFVAAVENYPQLKSNDAMVKAMETYQDVESELAASRRFYNTALRDLKNKTQIFPGTLFASFAGNISAYTYFQAKEDKKKSVDASDYLK